MRRVRYAVAASLDGCIAGPNGEYDWIVMDPDIDFGALAARFDTLLMGRKTYDAAVAQGGGPMPGLETIVFSTTLPPGEREGVTVSDDPAGAVARLRAAPGKDVWLFGGGELFRSLLELGLVDRVEVAVVPVLLGGGVPLFPSPAPRTPLRLVGQRRYEKTGTMLLEYEPA